MYSMYYRWNRYSEQLKTHLSGPHSETFKVKEPFKSDSNPEHTQCAEALQSYSMSVLFERPSGVPRTGRVYSKVEVSNT